jgi:thiol-disulfide isomerase/thioredoxin
MDSMLPGFHDRAKSKLEQLTPPNTQLPRRFPWLILVPGLITGAIMAVLTVIFDPSGAPYRTLPTPIPDLVTVGEPAPDFSGETPDGGRVSLSDFRGSVVAVNFWATWCGPCQVEMPILQQANEQGRLVILAVNAAEPADTVNTFMEDLGLTFPSVLDADSAIVDLYGVRVFPTTVFVDENGIVLAERYGPLTNQLIELYLNGN